MPSLAWSYLIFQDLVQKDLKGCRKSEFKNLMISGHSVKEVFSKTCPAAGLVATDWIRSLMRWPGTAWEWSDL